VLLYNHNSNFIYKIYYDNLFKKISYNSSIAKLRNFCSYLNNSRSVFKKFKLSRHKIKILAANGYLTGLKKSSF
jgi:ribosomal protein S14